MDAEAEGTPLVDPDPIPSEVHRYVHFRRWRHNAVGFTRELWRRLDETRAFGVAAETAFFIFLSLIPLAAVTGLVAARFSLANWGDVAPLVSSLPTAARRLVRSEMRELAAWNGGTVSLVSAVVFVWLASSGMHSIFDALELQVGAMRRWWKKRALAIGVCFAMPLVVTLLALVGPGFHTVLDRLGVVRFDDLSVLGRIIDFTASTTLIFAYVYTLFFLGIPKPTRRLIPLVPGALVTVGLQLLFGFGYGLYVSRVGDGSAYLAGLAVIGVTLMGLYLFSLALIIGATINRMLGEAAREKLTSP